MLQHNLQHDLKLGLATECHGEMFHLLALLISKITQHL